MELLLMVTLENITREEPVLTDVFLGNRDTRAARSRPNSSRVNTTEPPHAQRKPLILPHRQPLSEVGARHSGTGHLHNKHTRTRMRTAHRPVSRGSPALLAFSRLAASPGQQETSSGRKTG
ncbi:hypothetical protein FQA47_011109 [Oryzias melastigma]|uniref:Uncharacterized protein n=1 Tax=Oryzias melastigma TaxID=30732 RepID=A0A834BYV2_ORYME|nr:hypothetical protein FQA47_011109 [Oryzias melastigma]